jgi:hypothetical protein
MNKTNLAISITTILFIFSLSCALCSAKDMPTLKGASCATWVSFEDDTVYALNFYYREKGISQMKEIEESALRKSAYIQKLAYLQGLLDAYAQAYDMTGNDAFKYTMKNEDYITGIDDICGEQSNKDQKIVFVLAGINKNPDEK